MTAHATTTYPLAPAYARNPQSNYTYHTQVQGIVWTLRSKGHGKAKRWIGFVPHTTQVVSAKELHSLSALLGMRNRSYE